MFNILIMALRYIFLVFLLVFIIKLVKWMVGDLRKTVRDSSGRQEARLHVIESSFPDFKPGDAFALGGEKLLGRGETSDILIRDSFASHRHALIFFKEGQYWLEDLGSTNGTFLNEVKIDQPTVLADGDIIKIGGIIFQFMR